ncbi:MAG: hypothetical protein A3F09_05915 [Chlamydiae bacterium RIFCSPHIGHO2_12_FULL_49_11]|nr:MAG: hypothetical protein A3F09_05915 [Chlamydiae bacterium RIFCSPHIGHO2_12_FULL_49_11]
MLLLLFSVIQAEEKLFSGYLTIPERKELDYKFRNKPALLSPELGRSFEMQVMNGKKILIYPNGTKRIKNFFNPDVSYRTSDIAGKYAISVGSF